MRQKNFLIWDSFADIHAALAHAMAGNKDYLSKRIDGNSGCGACSSSCESLKAISENKWDKAREELESASSEFERLEEAEPKGIYLNLHM